MRTYIFALLIVGSALVGAPDTASAQSNLNSPKQSSSDRMLTMSTPIKKSMTDLLNDPQPWTIITAMGTNTILLRRDNKFAVCSLREEITPPGSLTSLCYALN